VSDEGVREIVRTIVCACADIPIVCTLEGGYQLATLARCVGITIEELLR
jgi:acetoin utilization deacetylase AcuC-like enzyme